MNTKYVKVMGYLLVASVFSIIIGSMVIIAGFKMSILMLFIAIILTVMLIKGIDYIHRS